MVCMHKFRWLMGVGAAVLALAMPRASHATTTTADDPGAFAALGSVYFSSVLEESGIGSGQGGARLFSGGSGHGHTGSSVGSGRAPSAGGAGTTPPTFGDVGPGLSPVPPDGSSNPATNPTEPGGSSAVPPTGKSPDVSSIDTPDDEILDPHDGPLGSSPPGTGSSVVILQVPEPASIGLLGIGLLGLGFLNRRRRVARS